MSERQSNAECESETPRGGDAADHQAIIDLISGNVGGNCLVCTKPIEGEPVYVTVEQDNRDREFPCHPSCAAEVAD